MIFYRDEFATIYLEEKYRLIHVELHGIIPSQNYREAMELALELVNEKKLTKWLGNLKDMGRMQVQDAEWREKIWFPRFLNSTIEKAAIVISTDYYNDLTFTETIKALETHSRINRKLFTEVTEAEAWLKAENSFKAQNHSLFPQ